MKGKQLKDFLELIHDSSRKQGWPFKDYTEDYRREWDSYRRDDGTYDNPFGGEPLTQEEVDRSISDRVAQDNKKNSFSGILGLDFSGLKEFFQPFTDLFSTFGRLVGGLFKGVNNLSDSELFNQGYSWLNQLTGANLTGKEQQMNAFNAEQAAIQRGWQERMSNTSFQRQVADMQVAGINPAMSMGSNGASTPAGSAASGNASPAQAAAILEMILGAKKIQTEKEMNERSTASAERVADITAKSHIRAAKIAADASRFGSTQALEGTLEMVRVKDDELEVVRNESEERIKLIREQVNTEVAQQILDNALANLHRVSAKEINALLPLRSRLLAAQGTNEYSQATLADLNGLTQQGLLDGNFVYKKLSLIDKEIEHYGSEVAKNDSEVTLNGIKSSWERYKNSCKDGSIFHIDLTDKDKGFVKTFEDYLNAVGAEGVFGAANALIENGVGKALGFGAGSSLLGRKLTTSKVPIYNTETGGVGYRYEHSF